MDGRIDEWTNEQWKANEWINKQANIKKLPIKTGKQLRKSLFFDLPLIQTVNNNIHDLQRETKVNNVIKRHLGGALPRSTQTTTRQHKVTPPYICEQLHNLLLVLFHHQFHYSQYFTLCAVQNGRALRFGVLWRLVTNVAVDSDGCGGRLVEGNGRRRSHTPGNLTEKHSWALSRDWLLTSQIFLKSRSTGSDTDVWERMPTTSWQLQVHSLRRAQLKRPD